MSQRNKLQLYDANGYINVPVIMELKNINFVVVVSARDAGKTYSGLKYAVENYSGRFMYLRRTSAIVDLLTIEKLQPFGKLNRDGITDIHVASKKKMHWFYKGENKLDEIGLFAAMNTFANVRSADFSGIDFLFYDEFVPETHIKSIKFEGRAFMNLIDTIARDREERGGTPLKIFLASNSDNIYHEILTDLGLTKHLIDMQVKQQNYKIIEQRHLLIINAFDCPAALRHAHNTLHEFNVDEHFRNVALYNQFTDIPGVIKSENLSHYNILCDLDGLCIYINKTHNNYYVTKHKKGNCKIYNIKEGNYRNFRLEQNKIMSAFYKGSLLFENIDIYNNFCEKLDIKH